MNTKTNNNHAEFIGVYVKQTGGNEDKNDDTILVKIV